MTLPPINSPINQHVTPNRKLISNRDSNVVLNVAKGNVRVSAILEAVDRVKIRQSVIENSRPYVNAPSR
jgi:hypothetical protein